MLKVVFPFKKSSTEDNVGKHITTVKFESSKLVLTDYEEKFERNLNVTGKPLDGNFVRAVFQLKQQCSNRICTRVHLGSNLVEIGSEKPLLQDEDHFVNDLQLVPGFLYLGSGTSPEQIRSEPELVGSKQTR